MTTAAAIAPRVDVDGWAAPAPTLGGLGFAHPSRRCTQSEITETLIDLWGLNPTAAGRFRRIAEGTGIEARYAVRPLESVIGLGTGARMAIYEQEAPTIAADAARAALEAAGETPERITDLVVVSCTGFSAPGLDVALIDALGLDPSVRRTGVGFMGCFGAITGLRTAIGACSADPRGVALVVCLEFCTLHLRNDRGIENQVASALFGDGAAAAVVRGTGAGGGGPALGLGGSRVLPEGRDWMSWRVTDAGFAMTLTRDVPVALREGLGAFVAGLRPSPASYVVHPGGPDILDAAAVALGADAPGLAVSREVLRAFGNMSSATVLFALDAALREAAPTPALLLAFGPGLTIEALSVGR